ncbi:MAG: hypothetical protein ACXWRE_06225 [Pseudobdellovibrionaceae bacterium]
MKSILLSLVAATMIPAISSAKVEDFNAMIFESDQAQAQLQKDLKEQTKETHQAQARAPKEILEVASDYGDSVNSPTKKSLTTYEKEMVHYRPSESKKMHRLATEIKAADKAF